MSWRCIDERIGHACKRGHQQYGALMALPWADFMHLCHCLDLYQQAENEAAS